MSLMGSLADNFGGIERAIIEVVDMRGRDTVKKSAVNIAGKKGVAGAGGFANVGSSYINKGLLGDVMGEIAGVDGGDIEDAYIKNYAKKVKRFTVQFNPSSLQLSGHAGGLVSKLDYNGDGDKSVQYTVGDTNISLSVELLFDAMDPQDAFMGDKFSAAPSSLVKGAVNVGLSLANKKKKSVQREVEGFIGALRNRYTRLVTFHWGDFNYSGVIRNILVNYTMFSVTGEPVRATVRLLIMCADMEIWPNSLAVWQEKYKQNFKKGSESFVKTSQKVGNLLSL